MHQSWGALVRSKNCLSGQTGGYLLVQVVQVPVEAGREVLGGRPLPRKRGEVQVDLAGQGSGAAAHDCGGDEQLVFVHSRAAAPGAWWNTRSAGWVKAGPRRAT